MKQNWATLQQSSIKELARTGILQRDYHNAWTYFRGYKPVPLQYLFNLNKHHIKNLNEAHVLHWVQNGTIGFDQAIHLSARNRELLKFSWVRSALDDYILRNKGYGFNQFMYDLNLVSQPEIEALELYYKHFQFPIHHSYFKLTTQQKRSVIEFAPLLGQFSGVSRCRNGYTINGFNFRKISNLSESQIKNFKHPAADMLFHECGSVGEYILFNFPHSFFETLPEKIVNNREKLINAALFHACRHNNAKFVELYQEKYLAEDVNFFGQIISRALNTYSLYTITNQKGLTPEQVATGFGSQKCAAKIKNLTYHYDWIYQKSCSFFETVLSKGLGINFKNISAPFEVSF